MATGAAIVGPSDTPGIGPVVWGSEGEAAEGDAGAGRSLAGHVIAVQLHGDPLPDFVAALWRELCRQSAASGPRVPGACRLP